MRNLLLSVVFVLLSILSLSAQHESHTTLVKSIELNGQSTALLHTDGETTVSEWDKDYVRIVMTVDAQTSDTYLKRLVVANRYDIQKHKEGDSMVMEMPNLEKSVNINGVDLQDHVSFKVYTPHNVHFDTIPVHKKDYNNSLLHL